MHAKLPMNERKYLLRKLLLDIEMWLNILHDLIARTFGRDLLSLCTFFPL